MGTRAAGRAGPAPGWAVTKPDRVQVYLCILWTLAVALYILGFLILWKL
ncbi:protein of unknown function (plasmid) [Rhodovastum atsumiense]|nr:protein of unknown function [Rhodovastum atsumiense]